MKINIKRGADTIGGNAIELTADNGDRIILDIGMPLDAPDPTPDLMPDIRGITNKTDDLMGVLISHAHADHYGLGRYIDEKIPVYIGAAARRIMDAATDWGLPGTFKFKNTVELKKNTPVQIGAFRVTPYRVDHAAYESFAFLIEADGKRIFYSGDFRMHGRKRNYTQRLIKNPPKNIDVLLMEGSSLDRLNPDQYFETEADLENRFVKIFRDAPGLCLVHQSSQNIDRIVSVFRACLRTGRTLVLQPYTGRILQVLENPRIPNFSWRGIMKHKPVPKTKHEISFATMAQNPKKYVYIPGGKWIDEMTKQNMLNSDTTYIYSMWAGYRETTAKPTIDAMTNAGVTMDNVHTSGHADIPTLRAFVQALNPSRLVPIHTFNPDKFTELFGKYATTDVHPNNTEWTV